jgi:hypothetical protein
VNVPAPIITLPTPVSSAKARLDFMFYPNNLNDAPMQTIDAHVVANFVTVGVTAKASKAQAEKGQVWIQICDLCKYAEEPKDSTAPPDDPTVRRKRFDVLHVGALFENTKLQVIPPPGKPFFTISLKYTCENCPPVDNDHPQRLKVNLIRP